MFMNIWIFDSYAVSYILSYPPTVPSSSFCRCAQATIQQPKAQLSLPTAPQKPTASHPTTSHHITPMTPRHAWPMVPPCPYCDPPVLALPLHRSFELYAWLCSPHRSYHPTYINCISHSPSKFASFHPPILSFSADNARHHLNLPRSSPSLTRPPWLPDPPTSVPRAS